ncbi:trypsin-like peptidase domain-containing protein [Lachnospiraceae bacterium 46-15]
MQKEKFRGKANEENEVSYNSNDFSLYITTGTTMNVGTVFLVGKSTILTAAHCFFDGNKKVSSVTFIPGKNGSSNPYGFDESTKLHIPTKYKEAYAANHEDEKWKYDYALVELSGTPGAKLGYFALGGYNTQYSIEKLVGEKAIVIGYPTTKMHRHKSDIIGYNSEKYQIYYTTDTTSGQSGAPVFIYTGIGNKEYIKL